MKKIFFIGIAVFIFNGCCPNISKLDKVNDSFLFDLGSENNRIAANLYLYVFNENIDTLSYSFYINYLEKNSTPSAKGLAGIIKSSDANYFEANSDFFFLFYIINPMEKLSVIIPKLRLLIPLLQLQVKKIFLLLKT